MDKRREKQRKRTLITQRSLSLYLGYASLTDHPGGGRKRRNIRMLKNCHALIPWLKGLFLFSILLCTKGPCKLVAAFYDMCHHHESEFLFVLRMFSWLL